MPSESVTLSQLITDEADTDVTIGAHAITVWYTPSKVTARALRLMTQIEHMDPLERAQAMPALICGIVSRWTLREDPPAGAPDGYVSPAVPITLERLEDVPTAILMRLMAGVFAHINMGKANGTPPVSPSPARSKARRRR